MNLHYTAVYDGHGGDAAAKYCGLHMIDKIKE